MLRFVCLCFILLDFSILRETVFPNNSPFVFGNPARRHQKRNNRKHHKYVTVTSSERNRAYRDWIEAIRDANDDVIEPCWTERSSNKEASRQNPKISRKKKKIRTKRQTSPTMPFSRQKPVTSSLYMDGIGSHLVTSLDRKVLCTSSGGLSNFTFSTWLKPEGGQSNHAIAFEFYESSCNKSSVTSQKLWTMGLHTDDVTGRPNFYFQVLPDQKLFSVFLKSPNPYQPVTWTHVTASYDGNRFILTIDGAVVSEVSAHIFTALVRINETSCFSLVVGSLNKDTRAFRGLVNDVKFRNTFLSQPQIKKSMFVDKPTIFEDNFDSHRLEKWRIKSKHFTPIVVSENAPTKPSLSYPKVRAPTCGHTICDNPEVAISYARDPNFRRHKIVNYRFVIVRNDHGDDPMVDDHNITIINNYLNEVFNRYNITWSGDVMYINDSSLRGKTIGCDPTKIGNKKCNRECMHERMGHDGGDCDVDMTSCLLHKRGDGVCDPQCNKRYHRWDGGDCCNPNVTDCDVTCFDPTSDRRAYLSVTEYKELMRINNEDKLNLLFANWTNPNSIGIATFPWDKQVFTAQGGTVVQLKPYTSPSEVAGIVHELGHNLGLLHVHHGLRKGMECDDVCVERDASLVTGDLCDDTNPTPVNTMCEDPLDGAPFCGSKPRNTPFNNYMSYADGSCQSEFTPQQVGRMHCYLDLIYSRWRQDTGTFPIPLPPKIVAASMKYRHVTVAWLPPITGRYYGDDCDVRCGEDKVLRQFASRAKSNDETNNLAYEAVGPPDQTSCSLKGVNFWMTLIQSGIMKTCHRCFIELWFDDDVIPSLLRIWVTYGTDRGVGLRNVELRHYDATVTSLGDFPANCDVPVTIRVNTNKMVSSIRVYPHRTFTAIDAIEVTSQVNHVLCHACRKVNYKVIRKPPFSKNVTTEELVFTDTDLYESVNYEYSVQPIEGELVGDVTKPVTFHVGQHVCGDGIVQCESEQCDDGNDVSFDGCDVNCRLETGFICRGEPSLCHFSNDLSPKHDVISHVVCSPFQSEDFDNQWAIDADYIVTSHNNAFTIERQNEGCLHPNQTIVGKPDSMTSSMDDVCDVIIDARKVWRVCNDGDQIKVNFQHKVAPHAILVYVTSPSVIRLEEIKFFYVGEMEEHFFIQSQARIWSWCKGHVIFVPTNYIKADVTQIMIDIGSSELFIDAVAIRSKKVKVKVVDNYDVIKKNGDNDCIDGNCTKEMCYDVIVYNATLSCYDVKNTKGYCDVTCNPGFQPIKTFVVSCDERVSDVTCSPITCHPPTSSDAVLSTSFTCESGYDVGSVCNYSCSDTSTTGSQVRCSSEGKWEVINDVCTCVAPTVNHASLVQPCDRIEQQCTCKFRCDEGYHVTQQANHRRVFRMTAQHKFDTWVGPTCDVIKCGELPEFDTGTINCTKGQEFGSVCSLGCGGRIFSENDDVMVCESNGAWRGTFPTCLTEVGGARECSHPIGQENVNFECKGYVIGKTCIATCGSPKYDITMTGDVGDNPLDPKPQQKTLVCSGEDRWFPDPSMISCVTRCKEEDLGDGWCDPENNAVYCSWDNGDCCASTTSSGKVVPFPSTCTNQCECKDPNSREVKMKKNQRKNAINNTDSNRVHHRSKLRKKRRRHQNVANPRHNRLRSKRGL